MDYVNKPEIGCESEDKEDIEAVEEDIEAVEEDIETDEEDIETDEIEDGFEILTIATVDKKAESQNHDKKEVLKETEVYEETKVTESGSPEPLETKEQEKNMEGQEVKAEADDDDDGWGWNSWTNWGTSVINTAANSVTTFTSQVGDGLIQVLETVESGLLKQDDDDDDNDDERAIPPEESSKQPITNQNIDPKVKDLERDKEDESPQDPSPSGGSGKSWLFSSLSSVVNKTTSVVQQTTNVVVHGGLDMLESIGKKTYDAITEGDHGLKKVLEKNKQRRKLPNLSQVLSEAREIAELKTREEESLLESKKFLYSYWFDEYQGLVQLEAFELLANQNESRTREEYDRLPKEKLAAIKKKLAQLNKIYKSSEGDSEDDESDNELDFNQLLIDYAAKLPMVVSVQKLLECQEAYNLWHVQYKAGNLKTEGGDLSSKMVLKKSMQYLAQMTALSIQHFHKLAQLMTKIVAGSESPSDNFSLPGTAQIVVDFSKVINREISAGSSKFVSIMSKFESSDDSDSKLSKEVSEHITTIYLESSNSTNFVQRSLKLLLPAFQMVVVTTE